MFNINLAKKLAELSKINFSEDELKVITYQMNDIINLMDRVKDVSQHFSTNTHNPELYKNLRTDIIKESYPCDEILNNPKTAVNNSFTVPKVV